MSKAVSSTYIASAGGIMPSFPDSGQRIRRHLVPPLVACGLVRSGVVSKSAGLRVAGVVRQQVAVSK